MGTDHPKWSLGTSQSESDQTLLQKPGDPIGKCSWTQVGGLMDLDLRSPLVGS